MKNCKIVQLKEEEGDFIFFGKSFRSMVNSSDTLIVHESFPKITETDIKDFKKIAIEKKRLVVSGSSADIHPYRLMYVDESGYAEPYADISQEIRGNRHLYPEVYQFIPALVYIPNGVIFGPEVLNNDISIYVMNREKLYDKTVFPDYLYLKNWQQGMNETI